MTSSASTPAMPTGIRHHLSSLATASITPVLAVALATVIASIVLLIAGHNPLDAWWELIDRTIFRPAGQQEVLVRAIPLLMAGLAVLVAARAGLWNIGIDGQVLVGALAAAAAAHAMTGFARPLIWIGAFAAGLVAGAAWMAVPALLRARYQTNEIVTTIMFNYVAFSLTAWLVKGPLRDASLVAPQTAVIPRDERLTTFGDSRVHAGLLLALMMWALVAFWFHRTQSGFDQLLVGESPRAARHALVSVGTIVAISLIVSGSIAGITGASDVLSTKGMFQAEWNPGYGLTAFALVFLARKQVYALIPAALFFGMLSYGADVMPRAANIPSAYFEFYEGILLVILAVFYWHPWRAGEDRS